MSASGSTGGAQGGRATGVAVAAGMLAAGVVGVAEMLEGAWGRLSWGVWEGADGLGAAGWRVALGIGECVSLEL